MLQHGKSSGGKAEAAHVGKGGRGGRAAATPRLSSDAGDGADPGALEHTEAGPGSLDCGPPPDLSADVAPNDLDAEGIVLSHALEHGAIDGLLPKHFYADCNRRIYEAVRMLQVRGEPVDVVAVKRELQRDGRLAQVGGAPYLAELVTTQPAATGAHLAAHAEAVRELYRRRVMSDAALRLRVELRTGVASSRECLVRFKAIYDEVTGE